MTPLLQAATDTVTVVPNIIVPSAPIWPTVVLGILTLLVLVAQLVILNRQQATMEKQAAIARDQQSLAEEQATWRRDEAIGTFYRAAFDVVTEFSKANVLPTVPIRADYSTHPRQMLREASRLFAPLGNDFVEALNYAAMHLDLYFSAVVAYNQDPGGNKDADNWQRVRDLRERVGMDLELVHDALPELERWKPAQGGAYNFRRLCAFPPALLGEDDTETGTPA